MEQWANGVFHADREQDAAARGEFSGYKRLIDLTFEDYQETIDDKE
jgi:hypothetical protein